MEFLGIGYQEVLLILVLMLVFVGPERLPGMAYQIGKAVRTLQQYARQVREEFSDEFGYIEEQYRVVKGEVDSTRESLRAAQARMSAELRDVSQPIRLAPTGTDAPGSAGQSNVVNFSDFNDGRQPDMSGITIVPHEPSAAEGAPAPAEAVTPPPPPAAPLLF